MDPVTKNWYKEKKESEEGQVEKRLRKLREDRARKEEEKLAGNKS